MTNGTDLIQTLVDKTKLGVNAGFDMACVVKEYVEHASTGCDMALIVEQTITRHEKGGICKFKEGALDRILNSPEFAALSQRIEDEEEICPGRDARRAVLLAA